jgi:hypothetical protein
MAQCDPQELMEKAGCFACLSPGNKAALELQLLCEIANNPPPVGGVTSIIAGDGISVDQATGDVTVTATGGGGDPLPVVVDAASMIPAVTNGAGVNTRSVGGVRVIDSVDFDTATQETVTFDVATPVGWAGSTFTAYFQWSTASGTAAQFVRFDIAARILGDGDAENIAFGTEQFVDDAIGTVDTIRISDATPAVTPAGTAAGGRTMSCRVRRVPASDDAPGDARLQKVFIVFA